MMRILMSSLCGVGMQDLKRSDPNEGQAEIYALQIADTVLVQPDGAAPELLTSAAAKGWTDIAYYFKVLHLKFATCWPSCFSQT